MCARRQAAVILGDRGSYRVPAKQPLGQQPTKLAIDAAANRVYAADPLDNAVWMFQERRLGRPAARIIARGETPPPRTGADCSC